MFGFLLKKYSNNPDLAERIFEVRPYQPYVKNCKDSEVKKVCWNCKNIQDTLNKVIEVCGPADSPKARYLYAIAYAWSRKEYNDKAIYYLEQYLNNPLYTGAYRRLNPQYSLEKRKKLHVSEMLGYLGKAYEKSYNFEKALDCQLKRLDLDPEFAGIYVAVSEIYTKLNQLNKALDILHRAQTTIYYKDEFKTTIDNYIENIKAKINSGYVYKPRKRQV